MSDDSEQKNVSVIDGAIVGNFDTGTVAIGGAIVNDRSVANTVNGKIAATEVNDQITATEVNVIASLVEFSDATSRTIVFMQQNMERLLAVVESQGRELARLRSDLEEMKSRATQYSAHSNDEPAGDFASGPLSSADMMNATGDQDALLEKMRSRKDALMKTQKNDKPEQKVARKDAEVANAKKLLLEMATRRKAA